MQPSRPFVRASITCAMLFLLAAPAILRGQLPDRPHNLQVLPKTLSTDSVFQFMLTVADGLGVTCGFCHVGGDNPTWDSTHFDSDIKPTKRTARAMLRLTQQLNRELIPNAVSTSGPPVPVTCATCHRGAPRPVALEDTLAMVLDAQGVDSTVAVYRRIRQRYSGRMTFDLTDWPLRNLAGRLIPAQRLADAAALLEEDERQFPGSESVAYQLGRVYEKLGKPDRAATEYHRVLALDPANAEALAKLRVIMSAASPHTPPGGR